MNDKESSFNRLWAQGKEFLTLKLEYAKLTTAEKLSVLFAMVAVALVLLLLGMGALLFLSISLAQWMAQAIGTAWSYAIIGGFYLVLMAVVIIFRKALFVNPVARFISRLILS